METKNFSLDINNYRFNEKTLVEETKLEIEESIPEDILKSVPDKEKLLFDLVNRIGTVIQNQNRFFMAQVTESGQVIAHVFEKRNLLGRGASGEVCKIDFLCHPIISEASEMALKTALSTKTNKNIEFEYELLKELHSKTDVVGIQSPLYLITTLDGRKGYITKLHKNNLKDPKTLSSGEELLKKSQALLKGMVFLHTHGVIHRDIKPANLCIEENNAGDEEMRIADFDGSTKLDNLNWNQIFDPRLTYPYACPDDLLETIRLDAQFKNSSSISRSEIRQQMSQELMWSLKHFIMRDTFKTLDSLKAMKNKDEATLAQIKSLENKIKQYHDEKLNSLTPSFNQNRNQLPSQREEVKELFQKQDVYALGLSLKEIFEGVSFSNSLIRENFDTLIGLMLEPDYKKRINAKEALRIFESLSNPLNARQKKSEDSSFSSLNNLSESENLSPLSSDETENSINLTTYETDLLNLVKVYVPSFDITKESSLKKKIHRFLSSFSDFDLVSRHQALYEKINLYFSRGQLSNLSETLILNKTIIDLISELEIKESFTQELKESINERAYRAILPDLANKVGILIRRGDLFFISEKTKTEQFTAYAFKKNASIAHGGFGSVSKIDFIGRSVLNKTPSSVIKEAYSNEDAQQSLEQEYRILKELHSIEGVVGIQSLPYLFTDEQGDKGYIARRFEFDLKKLTKRAGLSRLVLPDTELLEKSENLLKGLRFIHSQNMVHGDIKPDNLCAEDHNGTIEFNLSDFGGARKITEIDFKKFFYTSFTPKYTCIDDLKHLSKIQFDLHSSLGSPQDEAEFSAKYILSIGDIKLSNSELEQLFERPTKDLEGLKEDALELLRKHDVYAMGKSLKEIFEDVNFPTLTIREQFNHLIRSMMNPDYKKRIDADTALNLLSSLSQKMKTRKEVMAQSSRFIFPRESMQPT